MGGKGGGDAPNQYQQTYQNPMIDELAKQDLTVKALYQGADPLVKTQGQDDAANPVNQQQTAAAPQQLPVTDIGTKQTSGLGDEMAKAADGSAVLTNEEAAAQTAAQKKTAANLAQGA